MACVSKIGVKKETFFKSDCSTDIFCIMSKINYFRIITALNKKQSLNIQEISGIVNINQISVARYVRGLESKGLLLKQSSGGDIAYSLNQKNRCISLLSKLCN